MKFTFSAYDKAGHLVCDVIDAASEMEGIDQLRQRNLLVSDIKPAEPSAVNGVSRIRLPRSKFSKLRDLSMFSRQLASLVQSGIPLAQGLGALERQAKKPHWKAVIGDIRAKVEQGSTLSEAMRNHPDYFDPIHTGLVSAGESSGKLTELLNRIAALARKRIHVISTVRGAMVYPALLACVGAIVMTILLLFVVPRFADLFKSLGAPLPPTTEFLIGCSNVFKGYWYIFLAVLATGFVGMRYYIASKAGKAFIDNLMLRLPKLGNVLRSFTTARIARVLGVLSDSHLPIQDILRLTRQTTTNTRYVALLERAQDTVSHGEPVSSVFRDSDLVSPMFYESLRAGEQAGLVAGMLLEFADFLDEENDTTIKTLTSIIEPVMLVLMAVVVGFVAMSIFLPLFDVTSLAGGGG